MKNFDWSSATQQPLFKIRVAEDTLVISFSRPRPVVSLAPLHGGLRTETSCIINHRFQGPFDFNDSAKILRRAASRARIQGSFVGMITNADIGKYSLKTTQHEDLQVWALSTANTVNLATVGDNGSFVEGKSALN